MRLPSEHDWCAVCAIPACRVLRRACWPRSPQRFPTRCEAESWSHRSSYPAAARRCRTGSICPSCGVRSVRPARSASRTPTRRQKRSERIVWPIAMAYYVDVTVLGAWYELRNDFRHFRVERIIMATILNDLIPVDGRRLTERWFALQRERASDV